MNLNKNIGLGTDIESVQRFLEHAYDSNPYFYQNIFSDQEIKTCLGKPNPYQSFAARFAAKEAVIKAVSNLHLNLHLNSPLNLSFLNIEIYDQENIPLVKINKKGFSNFHVNISLSHTEDFATAVALVTKSEDMKNGEL